MKRTIVYDKNPMNFIFSDETVEVLIEYFHKINAVEIEIDSLVKSLNESSPLSKHQKILDRCDFAKKLYCLLQDHCRNILSSDTSDSKYINFCTELLDMMADIQNHESNSKEHIEQHKTAELARQRLYKFSMPNVNQIATDVISKIDTEIQKDEDITAQRAHAITRICKDELIKSLYDAESESLAVNHLAGIRSHYMDTLEENAALTSALGQCASQLEDLSTSNEKQKKQLTSLNKRLKTLISKQKSQERLLKKVDKKNVELTSVNEELSNYLKKVEKENDSLQDSQQELEETVHRQKKRRLCNDEPLVTQPTTSEGSGWTPGLFSWLFNQKTSENQQQNGHLNEDFEPNPR